MCSLMRLRYPVIVFCAQLMLAAAQVGTADGQIVSGSLIPSGYAIRELPITVAVSQVGAFGGGKYPWYLSVNSAGEAQLTINRGRTCTRRSFVVSREQLDELRNVLIREEFFDLEEHYGETVSGGSSRSLTVTAGPRTKTVELEYLMNYVLQNQQSRLRDPARALKVWMVIRGWFSDSDAMDIRKYDKRLLEEAEKAENRQET